MTSFSQSVAALTGVPEARLERLAGGDLTEVLLVPRPDGRCSVAKGGPGIGAEAAMLRGLAGAGVPTPAVEGEHESVLLLEHVPNDGVFSAAAWRSIGEEVRRLHENHGEGFGWPVDYRLGTVELPNRSASGWVSFWREQRLLSTARLLDRPWRERLDLLAPRLSVLIPDDPAPSLLHGDLWTGNILVAEGAVAALIDPACYHGHDEADLAMLALFDSPPPDFWSAYGDLEPGWEERRYAYQLFPALVHLRLFGAAYASMVDRLLASLGV